MDELTTKAQLREMRTLWKRWPGIERHVERTYWRRLQPIQQGAYWLARAARPLTRPLRFLRESWRLSGLLGAHLHEKTGPTRSVQVASQLMLYSRYGFSPQVYYDFMLYRNRYPSELYVDHHMLAYLQKYLTDTFYEGEHVVLDDKAAFYEHCVAHGLPTIPVLAEFHGGQVHMRGAEGHTSFQCDLFAKPVNLGRGAGARKWTFDGTTFREHRGETFTLEDILETLRRKSERYAYILQPCLPNHSELVRLTGEALASARIITGRKPEGASQILASSIRLPRTDDVVSHMLSGGVGAVIEESTGRLQHPFIRGTNDAYEPCPKHPDTGAEIAGFELPDWEHARKLTLKAHESLSRIAFVGWDVGFTPAGPILIEGNHDFGGVSVQVLAGAPLGASSFPEFFNLHFDLVQSTGAG